MLKVRGVGGSGEGSVCKYEGSFILRGYAVCVFLFWYVIVGK